MSQLSQFAQILENMAAKDFSKEPNALFIEALTEELYQRGVGTRSYSLSVACRMKVSLNSFDLSDPDWKRVVVAYGAMIEKLYHMYGKENLLELANGLSLKYEY